MTDGDVSGCAAELNQALASRGFVLSSESWTAERTAVCLVESADSTMSMARRYCSGSLEAEPQFWLKRDQEADGLSAVLLALEQTKGRGRGERQWRSPRGVGVFGTWLFSARRTTAAFAGFSLTAAVAVIRTCRRFGAENLFVKWPNDILLKDARHPRGFRKLSGVLCEVLAAPGGSRLSCGIGVNLSRSPQLEVEDAAGLWEFDAVRAKFPEGNRAGALFAAVAADLSRELSLCYQSFLTRGFEAFRDEWLAASAFGEPQCPVRVRLGPQHVIVGEWRGLSANGELILLVAGESKEQRISAGDLELTANDSGD